MNGTIDERDHFRCEFLLGYCYAGLAGVPGTSDIVLDFAHENLHRMGRILLESGGRTDRRFGPGRPIAEKPLSETVDSYSINVGDGEFRFIRRRYSELAPLFAGVSGVLISP